MSDNIHKVHNLKETTHFVFLAHKAVAEILFWDGANMNQTKFLSREFQFIMQGTVIFQGVQVSHLRTWHHGRVV